jgi:threonine/homoserine/homoserine lactone efflux protein
LLEAYFSLTVFCLLLLGSPGPAPLAIAATGAVFGIRKGLRFLFGLLTGFVLVLLIQGGTMFLLVGKNLYLMQALQLFGFLYILYIAYKIAHAPIVNDDSAATSAPSFVDGVVLNLSNPKVYAALTALNSQLLLPYNHPAWAYFMTGLVCFIVVTVVDLLWLLLGKLIRPLMQNPKTGRKVRMVFAVLMVVAVLWVMINNF